MENLIVLNKIVIGLIIITRFDNIDYRKHIGKENFIMKKITFDKCYSAFMKKTLWIIVIYIMANFLWIFGYFIEKIEYDTFIIFLFFGNILYIINRLSVIKTYFFIKAAKKMINGNLLKNKLQQVIFWNNMDTIFFDTGIIHYYKRKTCYIDYNDIQSIYRHIEKHYTTAVPDRGSIFNKLVNDYLIIVLESGEEYKIKVDVYLESVSASHLKTNEIISEVLKKNSKILVVEK